MIAATVRNKLATDYGIREIPHELLTWFIAKARAKGFCDPSTIAFVVANEWQRGLTTRP